ncbi:MAG: PIN domain-containing protein [Hyphomicrobiaceae bacterium]|nr:PIN domain-containing protein [Hyphomicrobiaceae bacterium]
MTARLFLDTNILIYALDPADPRKRKIAADLLRETISSGLLSLSPQSLNEAYRVLSQRRRLIPRDDARRFLGTLAAWARAPLDAETTTLAWEIEDETGYGWWDSLLLASALRAECAVFLSEDLTPGRMVREMRIVDPFG